MKIIKKSDIVQNKGRNFPQKASLESPHTNDPQTIQIIISHAGADFDALGSMVAAHRLYPEAKMFFVGSPEPKVREFVTLHRTLFPILSESDYRGEQIQLAVLVDTREPSRLGVFKDSVTDTNVEVHIYDHHPVTRESIAGDKEFIELTGAAVTILLKIIKNKKINIEPMEATLYLLALYQETGLLTFPGTTAQDIYMAAWLLELGGNLAMVPYFAQQTLTAEQRSLLGYLLKNYEELNMSGLKVIIATASVNTYIDELSGITQCIMEFERPDILFCIVKMAQRVYVVGRSLPNTVDIGRLMQEFGGGAGHPTAASARFRNKDPKEIAQDIKSILEVRVPRSLTAKDIMSTPVDCLDIDNPVNMEQAGEYLKQLGHSAVCVCQEGKLKGIVSRSDIDKALFHGLGHAPVQAYMINKLISVSPDSPVSEIQQILIENDIGRVPVLKGDKLLGIVSRTDILRALNKIDITQPKSLDLVPKELVNLPYEQLELLKRCGSSGDKIGFEVYAVGGFVRDMLLGLENNDLDLVVEGQGIKFAQHLAETLNGRCSPHEKFGTAVVTLPNGTKIDVVTARTEIYTRPAALPVVKGSTLKQDLYRRDFSINAMALRLSAKDDNFGQLVDFFGAKRDLQSHIIRILHNLSFVDDPTRIFRAIKFEQRYGFRMDNNTEHLLKTAVQSDLVSMVSPKRILSEIIQILSEEKPLAAIRRMDSLKVLKLLNPNFVLRSKEFQILENAEELVIKYGKLNQSGRISGWLVYLNALLSILTPQEANHLLDTYRIKAEERKKLLILPKTDLKQKMKILNRWYTKDSDIVHELKNLSLEGCLFFSAYSCNDRIRKRIDNFLTSLRFFEPHLQGKDLIQLGYKKGPVIGEILEWLWTKEIDGNIKTKEEAVAKIKEKWPLDKQ